MTTSTDIRTQPAWRYLLDIRLRLWRRNLADFWAELRKHPVALIAGVVILIYILAALFAPQITAHDPERGSLRQRLIPPAWARPPVPHRRKRRVRSRAPRRTRRFEVEAR